MSTGNQYFQPINLGGINTFTATGQTGWYQFDVPDALVPVLPGITVPANATGLVLQANTAIAYCFSPEDADLGTTAWLTLPAGGSVVVSGKQWVRQFCVRLGLVAGASFTVQFLTGNIGPILQINAPVTGGIIPPPPPGLSAIPTPQVLHVMPAPTGNDATGAPYRLDLPYATPAAAEAAAQVGDTIMIWAGDYMNVSRLGETTASINWVLQGATLNDDGVNPVFRPLASITTVEGVGKINCINGAPFAIELLGGTELTLRIAVEAGADGIRQYSSTVLRLEATVSGGVALNLEGEAAIRSNILGSIVTSGALCRASIWGDVIGLVTADQGSRLSINGNIIGDVLADNSATLTVRGTITGTVDSANSATLNQDGPVLGACTAKSSSTMNIIGNVQGDVTSDGGIVRLHGNVDSSINGVTAQNQGELSMVGNCINLSGTGVVSRDGVITFKGDILSDQDALLCEDGGVIYFHGRARSIQSKTARVVNGSMDVVGTLVSETDFGAQILAGTIRITGRIESCRACVAIEDSTEPYTAILGAGTVLVANVGGGCGAVASVVTLDGNPVNVISMGVYANLPYEPAVNAVVQAPVVNVNVQ